MASRLAYVGSTGTRVELDGPLVYVGTALGLRGRAWSYDLTKRGIANQSREAREATATVDFLSLAEADRARRAMDYDVASGAPGRLVSPDGWEQRAYVVAQEPDSRYRGWLRASLTVLLLDGVWRRLITKSYGRGDEADYGKEYPYGTPYDYAPPGNSNIVDVDAPAPCPMRLVVYGYARNPELTIGGNSYRFDVEVPTGGYLVVDTRPDPTVTLVDASGRSKDEFASAHRGAGVGSGEYAFQPLPPGVSTVGWDLSFGFDLGVYLEEGELPWTS